MGSVQATTQSAREVPLSELRQHPRNPRTITPARLAQLGRTLEAERDMLQARPLVALPDGTVIAGNQRLAAARELGWTTIPVVFADLDEERATRWMLLDNRGFGVDDADLAGELLAELKAGGVDVALTGYDPDEAGRLLRAVRLRDRDPDDAPPLPVGAPRSVRGEVYTLGEHRLMCGDATASSDLERLMDAPADALFTDPPYGVNYQGDEDPESRRRRNRRTDNHATVRNDNLGDEGTRHLIRDALEAALEHLTPGASLYVCAPSGTSETAFRLAFADAGLELRQVLVWAKDVFAMGRQDYHWRHESILYGWADGAAHRWQGGRTQDTVWEFPRPKRSELHPTMKPTALIARAIENSSRPGEIVLDPFAGSGSTLIAAEQTGRRCYAIEIDPAYCDVIRDRYAAFTDGGL